MKLYAFQETGAQWLAPRSRGILGDDPGLGKTPQAVVAATRELITDPWVFCPASARPVWEREWPKWGLDSVTPRVFSYDYVRDRGVEGEPDLLILDEFHNCNNIDAARTRAALKIAHRSPRVWLLSGTPIRNHAAELYAPLRAIWPDELRKLFGPHYDFMSFVREFTYFEHTRWGLKFLSVKNAPVLRELLGRIMLRRCLDDIALDLPPLRWETTPLVLDDVDDTLSEARQLGVLERELQYAYENVWNDELPEDGPMSSVRRILGKAKAVPAGQLIAEELRTGQYEKIVVMAYHRDVLNALEALLSPFGVSRIDGATAGFKRKNAEHAFQTNPEIRVFLGQIQAAGEAITLTAAHEVALVEQMWTPTENYQAVKRIHRITQDHPCRARMFVAHDTLDDAVGRVLARKLQSIGQIVHI